jgi:hypothetical protein
VRQTKQDSLIISVSKTFPLSTEVAIIMPFREMCPVFARDHQNKQLYGMDDLPHSLL